MRIRTLVLGLVVTIATVVTAAREASVSSAVVVEDGRPAQQPATPAGQQQGAGQQDAQPPAAQDPGTTAPPQQPTFKAGINFVRVDVIVTDKQGNPVVDLQQADFEVLEDGKPQTVETFRLLKQSGTPQPGGEPAREIRTVFDEENEAARDDVRLFAIFLDDYHVRRGAAMAVREPLIRFIETQLGPLDMIAVMYPLTPVGDLTFTRNHQGVAAALQKFDGRKYDYTPRNEFENQYSMYPAATVERIRNQVSLSALKGLVTHMGGMREGRKSVIVVTEGYTNYLPPQLRDPVADMPGLNNPNRRNPMAGEGNQMEDSQRFFSEADMNSDLREVYNAANRGNAALYTLDPRGLAVAEFDINENVSLKTDATYLRAMTDTLRVLADQTDGRALVGRNDLDAALRQVTRDSSAYYLIGYNSANAPQDGKFHEIKVRVKRPGVQVRARKGYWALTAAETAAALAPPKPAPPAAVTNALGSIAEPSRGRLVRTWIGLSRADSGKTRVSFVWEPLPPVQALDKQDVARVSLTALASDGTPLFRGRVPEQDAPAATSNTASGAAAGATATTGAAGTSATRAPAQVQFEVPPGRIQMRASIEGADGRTIDSMVQEIVVPDYTAPGLALGTPIVLRARNGLEFRTLSTDSNAVPTPTREFRRTDRLLIRVGAYAPGNAVPNVAARLLNRTGTKMADLQVAPAQGAYQVDLPLASLAPGEYLVEVTAKLDAGDVKELVAFKVTS